MSGYRETQSLTVRYAVIDQPALLDVSRFRDPMKSTQQDEKWMRYALVLAQKATEMGEVPVGAVLVKDDELLAEGWNQPVSQHDPTAHAEIVALRHAASTLQNYRLPGTTLYITIEPCSMCAGAIIHARVSRVVFGATEPRAGAAGSAWNILQNENLNHQVEVTKGVLAEECGQVLKDFFQLRRKKAIDN
jgi:tRNA(adenine34) deaminase